MKHKGLFFRVIGIPMYINRVQNSEFRVKQKNFIFNKMLFERSHNSNIFTLNKCGENSNLKKLESDNSDTSIEIPRYINRKASEIHNKENKAQNFTIVRKLSLWKNCKFLHFNNFLLDESTYLVQRK
ncbi:hypothetical protein BpHYR1_032305 [Brachionus plicatilis]|uniref:Uncharacterized protein n=1 Tax=Brachionus plicatilis TaxID=10195 RepID=A0A3M7Q6B0_BRAPC|nr:hypothetical protein BpHYR1_032305 [Brachionus plicatilis]